LLQTSSATRGRQLHNRYLDCYLASSKASPWAAVKRIRRRKSVRRSALCVIAPDRHIFHGISGLSGAVHRFDRVRLSRSPGGLARHHHPASGCQSLYGSPAGRVRQLDCRVRVPRATWREPPIQATGHARAEQSTNCPIWPVEPGRRRDPMPTPRNSRGRCWLDRRLAASSLA
jgi:hypothetical protein